MVVGNYNLVQKACVCKLLVVRDGACRVRRLRYAVGTIRDRVVSKVMYMFRTLVLGSMYTTHLHVIPFTRYL